MTQSAGQLENQSVSQFMGESVSFEYREPLKYEP